MKRSLSVILTAAMVLSLFGCGVQAPETPAATEAPAQAEAPAAETPAAETAAEAPSRICGLYEPGDGEHQQHQRTEREAA